MCLSAEQARCLWLASACLCDSGSLPREFPRLAASRARISQGYADPVWPFLDRAHPPDPRRPGFRQTIFSLPPCGALARVRISRMFLMKRTASGEAALMLMSSLRLWLCSAMSCPRHGHATGTCAMALLNLSTKYLPETHF